jgi:hypothetical protein
VLVTGSVGVAPNRGATILLPYLHVGPLNLTVAPASAQACPD